MNITPKGVNTLLGGCTHDLERRSHKTYDLAKLYRGEGADQLPQPFDIALLTW